MWAGTTDGGHVYNLYADRDTYGETRYYNANEWGTAGSNIVGTNIKTLGTALTAAANGFALSPTTEGKFENLTYSMSWYQPKYATRYSSTGLKRYNGGSTDGSKVRGYCMGMRLLSGSTKLTTSGIVPANGSGLQGVVTLSGASALAAGAIAFGVTALAF